MDQTTEQLARYYLDQFKAGTLDPALEPSVAHVLRIVQEELDPKEFKFYPSLFKDYMRLWEFQSPNELRTFREFAKIGPTMFPH